jgi:hypothetical protein
MADVDTVWARHHDVLNLVCLPLIITINVLALMESDKYFDLIWRVFFLVNSLPFSISAIEIMNSCIY